MFKRYSAIALSLFRRFRGVKRLSLLTKLTKETQTAFIIETAEIIAPFPSPHQSNSLDKQINTYLAEKSTLSGFKLIDIKYQIYSTQAGLSRPAILFNSALIIYQYENSTR